MTEWSSDWSYAYLRTLLAKVGKRHKLALLSAAPKALESEQPVAFIRHDVDVCLDRARALAEREAEWGVVATYHVMLTCPFYDVTSRASRHTLASINALGHEIGLHFHPPVDGDLSDPDKAAEVLDAACERFEDATGGPVRSVSFHLPPKSLFGGPLLVAGRVNAYAKPLVEWYLSDSMGRWREGEPLLGLDTPRANHLQMLVHPLWWSEKTETPPKRLRGILDELAAKRTESVQQLSDMFWDHIIVRADGTSG